MADLRITPGRLQLLRQIADPKIGVSVKEKPQPPHRTPRRATKAHEKRQAALAAQTGSPWDAVDVFVSEYPYADEKVTAKIRPLADAGLVEIGPAPRGDWRKMVVLTEAGEKVLSDAETEARDGE